MANTLTPVPPEADDERLHDAFLALLPALFRAVRLYFRFVRCPGRREDLIGESIALAWVWHCRLAERGRDPARFARTFARLAAKAAGSGRRVCGQEPVKDVLSNVGARRHEFAVLYFPAAGGRAVTGFEDALADNTQSPVPAQVQFRTDFPAWRQTLSERDRGIVEQLALGHRTQDVAQLFGLTPGRVSQMRRAFHSDYMAFLSDTPEG